MTQRTFTTATGRKVTYRGQFRYFVYGEAWRFTDTWENGSPVYEPVSKPWVEYRTDSIENARKGVKRAQNRDSSRFGIIDTVTGEVVR
jgi:hypothetical protein